MLDWDDLRYYLAIVRRGNLSAAALEIGVAQSTVGRRLAILETSLGVRLLERTPDGYIQTQAGREIFHHAERVESETNVLQMAVGGRDTRLAGTVRVTCPEGVASLVLAPCLALFHNEQPDIEIQVLPENRHFSLAMREAEISISLTPPDQQELVVRRLASIKFGIYASQHYLAQNPTSPWENGGINHYAVSQIGDLHAAPSSVWIADLIPNARVSMQTNSHAASLSATVFGAGLASLARFRADGESGLSRLKPPGPMLSADIWLMVHKDNRYVARIRSVINYLAMAIANSSTDFSPED